ncbi:hypothetical protein [Bacillus sp. FSL W7-1085]|uniref:hypothetical protein n=1 Tax=Bacillus sp. FSL W7-1085 TaxID=2921694 RepID=UPI00315B0480
MKMSSTYSNIIFLIIIVSLFLGDLIIYTGLLNLFFEDKETLWAGIIGFTGAVIGGGITYYGIRMQLNHKDREVFIQSVQARTDIIQEYLSKYGPYYYYALDYTTNGIPRDYNYVINEFIDLIQDERISHMSVLDYEASKKIRNLTNSLMENREFDLTIIDPVKALKDIMEFYELIRNFSYQLEDRFIELKRNI